MSEHSVFVSVGSTATEQQEVFVRAVEDRLRSEGIEPRTVGRNSFSADAPLKQVATLLDECSGIVVIALERSYFPSGKENRGGAKETAVSDVKLPTPWNQIEAAMAYTRDIPLLVIVESGLKREGLLEHGNEWYVQLVAPNPAALGTNEFNGVLASWKAKLATSRSSQAASPPDVTLAELLGRLRPIQLWGVLVALSTVVGIAFVLGSMLFSS